MAFFPVHMEGWPVSKKLTYKNELRLYYSYLVMETIFLNHRPSVFLRSILDRHIDLGDSLKSFGFFQIFSIDRPFISIICGLSVINRLVMYTIMSETLYQYIWSEIGLKDTERRFLDCCSLSLTSQECLLILEIYLNPS